MAFAAIIGSWFIYRKYGVGYIDHLVDDLIAHKEDAKVSREELVDAKSRQAKTEAKLKESENKYKSIVWCFVGNIPEMIERVQCIITGIQCQSGVMTGITIAVGTAGVFFVQMAAVR